MAYTPEIEKKEVYGCANVKLWEVVTDTKAEYATAENGFEYPGLMNIKRNISTSSEDRYADDQLQKTVTTEGAETLEFEFMGMSKKMEAFLFNDYYNEETGHYVKLSGTKSRQFAVQFSTGNSDDSNRIYAQYYKVQFERPSTEVKGKTAEYSASSITLKGTVQETRFKVKMTADNGDEVWTTLKQESVDGAMTDKDLETIWYEAVRLPAEVDAMLAATE